MSRLFISHSNANNAQALALSQWLVEHGWDDHFLDISGTRGLAAGERWQEALKAAADRCEAVLFLLSPAWVASRWCLAEFLLAKQLGKTIFGVLVESMPLESLPVEITAEWQLCDLVAGDITRSFGVTLPESSAELRVALAEEGLTRLAHGLRKAGLDPSTFLWPPPNDPERAPYRGLKPLEAEDAAVYFGRDAAIVRGLDTLRAMRERGVERMMVILGASGSGKSSFLRAGLWPRLARDDRHFVVLRPIRPERAAVTGATGLVASLEQAFRALRSPKSRASIGSLLREQGGLSRLVDELVGLGGAGRSRDELPPTLVVPIDQAEELFAADGSEEGTQLLALLGPMLTQPAPPGAEAQTSRPRILVIVAIRSDAYERLQTAPQLGAAHSQLFSLPPMAAVEYKAVIEGPAARETAAGRKLTIDAALTERLLDDAQGADALPLLAFVLERLCAEHGTGGTLTLSSYEDGGGIRGAIEAAVETALREPGREPAIPGDPAEVVKLLRRAFIPALARIDPVSGEAKRRVARWDELPRTTNPLIERLIDQRLIVRDRRALADSDELISTLEIAHEALLRQWPLLAAWLAEDSDALKQLEVLHRAAADWDKNARSEEWLVHSGTRLSDAEAIRGRADFAASISDIANAYVGKCRERDDVVQAERELQLSRIAQEQARVAEAQEQTAHAQRRATRTLWFVATALAVFAVWIVMQARDVSLRTSVVLTDAAQRALDSHHTHRALRLAVLASRRDLMSVSASLSEAVLASSVMKYRSNTVLEKHGAILHAASFNPDGTVIVVSSADGSARVYDFAGRKLITALEGHQHAIRSGVFSPNGKVIATASVDRKGMLWDAESGKKLLALEGHRHSLLGASFSPDGKIVATASMDRTARLWDATNGKQLSVLEGHGGSVFSAMFSPDGKSIVTASDDRTARLWSVASGRSVGMLDGHRGSVRSAVFSRDGKLVVTASNDGTARLWDVGSATPVRVLEGHREVVLSAEFSSDSRLVGTSSADGTARIWDAASGKVLAVLEGHGDWVNSVAFSPDGKVAVTTSNDKTARLWQIGPTPLLTEMSDINHLRQLVCERIVPGRVTAADIVFAPILSGREDEDVCDRWPLFSRLGRTILDHWRAVR